VKSWILPTPYVSEASRSIKDKAPLGPRFLKNILRGDEKRWRSLEKGIDPRKIKERKTWAHQREENKISNPLGSQTNFVSIRPVSEAMGAQ
jgi:hypothetical protein